MVVEWDFNIFDIVEKRVVLFTNDSGDYHKPDENPPVKKHKLRINNKSMRS